MNDPYATFVWLAYGISAVTLIVTAGLVLAAYRRVKKQLAALGKAP
jgi:heme exporter protein CcmD